MKYLDVIGLHDYFSPYYVMGNESEDYWKQFIPNEGFNGLLKQVLSAVDTNDTSLRKSFWIQGSFGTGKSHAAGVVKQLLWQDWDKISDYVEDQISDAQVKSKLSNFRKKKKLLPIVISGIGSVIDHRSFSLEIERAVKHALKGDKELSVKSDFEKYIEKAANGTMPCEFLIENDEELGLYVNNKEEIINELKAESIKFIRLLENALSKQNIHYSHSNITQWLVEINQEVIDKGIADGIIIYWDEFTTIMDFSAHNQNADSVGAAIINIIQSIAELSVRNNIYLYLISHRKPEHYDRARSREDIQKMRDRFYNISYEIEPITTFHILSAAIKKINKEAWHTEKDNTYTAFPALNNLVSKLTDNHSSNTKEAVKNLFPIHPYSAYLSTFIARNIGSANRSVFEFLHNKEHGFGRFLSEEIQTGTLLTADYLWDYFAESFEQDPKGDFRQILDKYRLYGDRMKNEGDAYLKVFKSILLLNVLYKKIDISSISNSYVTPSITNILSLFSGLPFENQVPDILSYICEKEIIEKTPTNYFLIEFSSLPYHEVEKEKQNLQNTYNNDIVKILTDIKLKKELEDRIFNETIYRANEVLFLSSTTTYNEHVLKTRLLSTSSFQKSYTLHIAFFLSKTNEDKDKTIGYIEKLSKDEDLNNIIFVFADEVFGESNYDKFIDFIARKQVSDTHRYEEQAMNYQNYATQHIEKWINTIKERNVTVFFRGKENKILANELGANINKQYAPDIFSKGIDSLSIHKNIWKELKAKATSSIEKVLFPNDRAELQNNLSKGVDSYLLSIFQNSQKEFVVDYDLNIRTDIDTSNHPLRMLQNYVEEVLDKQRKKAQFNLGKELEDLKTMPFGLFKNMPNMALIGFVFRKYVDDDLQTADTGRQIGKEAMRDLIAELFENWDGKSNQNKLQLRFGSKEERKLKLKLIRLFDLKDVDSIIDSRFAIREYINRYAKYPLWSIWYFTHNENIKKTVDEMQNLMSSFAKDLDNSLIKKVLDAVDTFDYELRDDLKPENFKTGFINFIRQIPNIQVTDSDINDILTNLKQNLGGDIWSWEKDKVQDKVLIWYLQKKTPPPPTPILPKPTGSNNVVAEPPINNLKKKSVITNIRNSKLGEHELKEKVIAILEKHPEIQSVFEQYFNEE
jgi:hypothetical protein